MARQLPNGARVVVISFDTAVVGLAPGSDEVITQVTFAPLVNVAF